MSQSSYTSAQEQAAAQEDAKAATQEQAAQSAQRSRRSKSRKSASAFRTISEVADGLGVQQHVLRFWETKFSQVRPLKRGGGRRYYRPEDVALLQSIHHLLYTEGYTIKGVQKLLKEQGKSKIVQNNKPVSEQSSNSPNVTAAQQAQSVNEQTVLSGNDRSALETTLADLRDMRRMLVAG